MPGSVIKTIVLPVIEPNLIVVGFIKLTWTAFVFYVLYYWDFTGPLFHSITASEIQFRAIVEDKQTPDCPVLFKRKLPLNLRHCLRVSVSDFFVFVFLCVFLCEYKPQIVQCKSFTWYLIYSEPLTKHGEWVSVKYCVPRLIMICCYTVFDHLYLY